MQGQVWFGLEIHNGAAITNNRVLTKVSNPKPQCLTKLLLPSHELLSSLSSIIVIIVVKIIGGAVES